MAFDSSFRTFVFFLSFLSAQSDGTVRVTVARANLRQEASDKSPVITQVTAGTTLLLKGVEGDWFRVQLPPDARLGGVRIEAYISKKVSAVVTPAAPAPSKPAAAAPITPHVKDGMSVAVQTSGASTWLLPMVANVVRLPGRADSVRHAAAAMPLGETSAPAAGSAQITYVWTIESAAARAIEDARAAFVVQFKDVPGVSPDDFAPAIVRLAGTASGARVVATVRGRADHASRTQLEWDVERDIKHDLIQAMVEQVERGVARIQPAASLPPGEYAVILRPTGRKRFAGASVFSDTGEGRVFGLAWPFVIK